MSLPDWSVRLRNLRLERGLKQEVLAQEALVSVRSITNWEAGRHSARHSERRKVLDVLGVPFERHQDFFGPSPAKAPGRPKGVATGN